MYKLIPYNSYIIIYYILIKSRKKNMFNPYPQHFFLCLCLPPLIL